MAIEELLSAFIEKGYKSVNYVFWTAFGYADERGVWKYLTDISCLRSRNFFD